MLRIRSRAEFDQRKVRQKVQQATFRNLGHAGGAIRKTASRSIRKRKKPSKPGNAPHTPTGHLRRVIRYAVDKEQGEVAIGPTNPFARTIWNLHEFGGTTRPKPRLLKHHKFRVGDYGPVRKTGKKRFTRAKLQTIAQAKRATELVATENAERIAASKGRRRYPKRPFMGPALEKLRDRLPKFWADSVKG